MSNIEINWLVKSHLPFVVAIESVSFATPWTEEDFRRHHRRLNCIAMVAEVKDRVVGYVVYELHKDRLHVINLAVCPNHRGIGIGTALVEKLQSKLSYERRNRITLLVSDRNLAAQLFFKRLGFLATDVLKDYYDDCTDDAYYMVYRHVPSVEEIAEAKACLSK